MWRDCWLALGVIGATLACLSGLTPFAVVALAAFIALVIHRYRVPCRRAP
jgi:uncharacterized membrane protein YbaN (DUF454 family)